jgi:hypothetical protein
LLVHILPVLFLLQIDLSPYPSLRGEGLKALLISLLPPSLLGEEGRRMRLKVWKSLGCCKSSMPSYFYKSTSPHTPLPGERGLKHYYLVSYPLLSWEKGAGG